MGASEVMKWQQRYRIECDASDGRHGGVQRTVWENLMEMEKFNQQAGEEDLGAVGLGSGPGEGLRARQPPSGQWIGAWATHFQLPKEDLAGVLWVFLSTRGECSSKDVWRSRSRLSRPSCHQRVYCVAGYIE